MTDKPRPVSRWENQRVNGHALSVGSFFNKHIEDVENLRDQQAEYLDGLPTKPLDAIREGFEIMGPSFEEYLDGFEEALHLSHGIEALINSKLIDEIGPVKDAATFLAARLTSLLGRTQCGLDRLSDTLRNPARLECAARTGSEGKTG